MPNETTTMGDHARKVLAHQEDEARKLAPADEVALFSLADQANATAAQADEQIAVRVQTALTMKSFLPDETWAAQATLGKPRGGNISLGRVLGVVTGTERKETMFGGQKLESWALHGQFTALAELRGETLQASQLYLSKSFSEQIVSALAEAQATDPHATIKIDVDVGVEPTGKQPVSYGWTVTHYLTGGPSRALREIHQPRRLSRPQALLGAA
jgi:hypothetical protein